MARILVIEDDPAILMGLSDTFEAEHYEVLTATDGEKGSQMARRENIDLIILDLMLPKKNGEDVCRELRRDGIQTPIMMLTSKKKEIDHVVGLEIGADDYMTKPFSLDILRARIKALLRRRGNLSNEIVEFSFGNIYVDFKRQEVIKDKRPLKLTSKEFDVLKYFVQHESEVITRDMLLTDVWEYGDEETIPTTRTVDNYILSLRKKIEDDPSKPTHILTVHTMGYKFVK